MRPLFDIIEANRPFSYMRRVFMPVAVAKKQARPFLLGELERFRQAWENSSGKRLTTRLSRPVLISTTKIGT